jgi:acyl carrier protein
MELSQQIKEYLGSNLIYVDDGFDYDNDASFIREGLIDSMQVMELVLYVQSSFGIPVEQEDIIPENFDSVNKLASFIRRKQTARAEKGN